MSGNASNTLSIDRTQRRCPKCSALATTTTEGYDSLTGLLNHRAFLDALSRARGQCRRRNERLALILIDVDHFRRINQAHSHAVGDRVLAWLGASLGRLGRASDIVSRHRWDRFAVALPGSCETQTCQVAGRWARQLFSRPLVMGDRTFSVRASFGLADTSPGFVESEQELIERAEHALTVAKQRGGGCIVGFSALPNDAPSRQRLDQASLEAVSRWIGTTRHQLKRAYLESTRALVGAVEAKDTYTRRHSMRVSDYAETLGTRLGVPPSQLESLKTAAVLHDVGKIGIPDAILRKRGPLTRSEYDVVKQHPETGLRILGHASFLSAELPIIRHHHERWDGLGYPSGLAGREIPFGARILAVADSLDAMFSRRSYKKRFDVAGVRRELLRCAGTQWDPDVVQAALQWLDDSPESFTAC
ncbi:MAG TPA: diguanylate cyclase [Phycisphaerae bacterium]|nr:diguanylate cyclase [Phycisphaerae bacterium]